MRSHSRDFLLFSFLAKMMLHTARPQTVGGDQADDGSSKPPPMPNYHMVIHPEAHTRKEKRKASSNSKWWTEMFSCLNCAG